MAAAILSVGIWNPGCGERDLSIPGECYGNAGVCIPDYERSICGEAVIIQ